jgi:hypothetical protein
MYKEISKCRICGNENLDSVVDLGMQALTGVFPKEKAENVEISPLELVKCNEEGCGLLQLKHSNEPGIMYGENYGYRSGLNQSMVRHLKSKVQKIETIINIEEEDLIIDIGSNDSTLLQSYSVKNVNYLGIDPTGVKFKKYYPDYIDLIPDFFSAKVVKDRLSNKKAKVITSIAMFYDLESPLDFMKDIYDVLNDEGIWHFEQSYMPFMIENTSYDTICHEHLEYYGLQQINWMAEKVGFQIENVEFNDINGGSFAITASKKNSGRKISVNVEKILKDEIKKEYNTIKPYLKFAEDITKHKKELTDFIKSEVLKGKKIFGYGASTKGNVILQYCDLNEDEISYIAEINEEKFGRYTPGTLIPIISEEEARKLKPAYFFVLPWHFKENILEREKKYIKNDIKFLFPLPKIEII